MEHLNVLEFTVILNRLAALAYTESAKARCLSLCPCLNEKEANRRLIETTEARKIIEQTGTPPLTSMQDIEKLITLVEIGDELLSSEQIEKFSLLIAACRRMKQYLKRAESTGSNIALYGGSITELPGLYAEIDRCIRGGRVEDRASSTLYSIRRQTENLSGQIRARLNTILLKNRNWFSDSFVSERSGRYTLPVKREFKANVPGTVVEYSNTGGTCFIEPQSVTKLQQEIAALAIEEDGEIRRILYTLTAQIAEALPDIRRNIEAMETLDFLFAKARLGIEMKASPPALTVERKVRIQNGRHPLLHADTAVALNFTFNSGTRGVVITGPNTGGKTVALKTVGLLTLMAQSGLHVPADGESVFSLCDRVLCDIGDGQSISENLSTFSSHMTNIIEILQTATRDSLVLLDELGSGTDPAEGMGLAVAILEELCLRGCLFMATTHYPEVKSFVAARDGLQNARMAFDRQSLLPLYRLEIGEAGESCALHIAKRLGMPEHILKNAEKTAYSVSGSHGGTSVDTAEFLPPPSRQSPRMTPGIVPDVPPKPVSGRAQSFQVGDSVTVYPQKVIGIVYARANDMGEVGVQIKKSKKLYSHKRIKLRVPATELYPENYDFSIIFDAVTDRKARHIMGKRHEADNTVVIREDEKDLWTVK